MSLDIYSLTRAYSMRIFIALLISFLSASEINGHLPALSNESGALRRQHREYPAVHRAVGRRRRCRRGRCCCCCWAVAFLMACLTLTALRQISEPPAVDNAVEPPSKRRCEPPAAAEASSVDCGSLLQRATSSGERIAGALGLGLLGWCRNLSGRSDHCLFVRAGPGSRRR